MEKLKVYENIQNEEDCDSFGIAKMEDIYAQRKGQVDEAHRHNYYTVLIVASAKGQHKIDFTSFDLGPQQVYFVAPGQVHQVIEEEASTGFVLTFTNQFLVQNAISTSFISSLNLFQHYGYNPPLIPSSEQFETITEYANQIFRLFHSKEEMKLLSIGAFLKLLLIQCNNICTLHPIAIQEEMAEKQVILDFKREVDQHYKQEHSTSFYANLLHLSPDHLNRIIKSTLGKTAKEYIQSRLITEAKRLLYFTDLNNKEIGYTLGFSEPANFSAFFKKCTNYSPSQFKKTELRA